MEGITQLRTTEALILRKTEYSESSLITAVLTLDFGQQHIVFKGARKRGKKQFPVADLFRHLRITYKPSATSELNTVRDPEILQIHDAIALNPTNFGFAVWLSKFTLKNTQADISVPNLFQALKLAFTRLSIGPKHSCLPIIIAVCIVMLADNGLLPEYSDESDYQSGFEQVIQFGLNWDFPLPNYPESFWKRLGIWTQKFIVTNTDLALPKGDVFGV